MAAAVRWALPALLWARCLAPEPGAQPPKGFEDDLLCPPGHCRRPEPNTPEEQAKHPLKQECSSEGAKDADKIIPKGLGEKLEASTWKELTEAGWHSVTCLEVVHGACPYVHGSSEWTVCRVASNFLLTLLGELNGGAKKTVPNVRGLLEPYLGGPRAEVPNDPNRKAQKKIQSLWQKVNNKTAEKYISLDLDASALTHDLMKGLQQDGFGNLEPARKKDGKPVEPGLAAAQVIFGILGASNWRLRYLVDSRGWSVYTWHLAIGLTIAFLAVLMVGIVMWRAWRAKSRVPD